jgi:hypothetical protein
MADVVDQSRQPVAVRHDGARAGELVVLLPGVPVESFAAEVESDVQHCWASPVVVRDRPSLAYRGRPSFMPFRQTTEATYRRTSGPPMPGCGGDRTVPSRRGSEPGPLFAASAHAPARPPTPSWPSSTTGRIGRALPTSWGPRPARVVHRRGPGARHRARRRAVLPDNLRQHRPLRERPRARVLPGWPASGGKITPLRDRPWPRALRGWRRHGRP